MRSEPTPGRAACRGWVSPLLASPDPRAGRIPATPGRLQTLNCLTLVTFPGKAGRCFYPEGHLLICTRKCCRGSTSANPPVERVPSLGARPTGGQRGEVAGRLGSKGRGVGGIEGAVTSGSHTRRTPLKVIGYFREPHSPPGPLPSRLGCAWAPPVCKAFVPPVGWRFRWAAVRTVSALLHCEIFHSFTRRGQSYSKFLSALGLSLLPA